MPRFSRETSREQRLRVREIARDSWIASMGDVRRAKRMAKSRVKEEFGNIIIFITVAAALLQIAYTLFRFWKDTRVVCPEKDFTMEEAKFLKAELALAV